jgi:rhodanese-related sulfurtransferase
MSFLSKLFGSNENQNLKSIINEGAFLVDVRTPSEFSEGHVNGSVNIPLDTVPQNLKKFENKKNIIVFCRSGNRSGQAKAFLDANGFKNVVNGGTWQDVKGLVGKK